MSIKRLCWSHGPLLASIILSAIFVWGPFSLLEAINKSDTAAGNLTAAVFDLASILAALMFGLYTFIGSSASGYYRGLKKFSPIAFSDLMNYFSASVISGMFVVVFTVPVLIVSDSFFGCHDVIIALWACMSIFSVLLAARAMIYLFAISQYDNPQTSSQNDQP